MNLKTAILDLTSLESAIRQLETAIGFATSDLGKKNEALFEQFRNSTIQCFEFTYELCWRFLKRRMELDSPSPSNVDQMDYRELMRDAAIQGLIQNPNSWFTFRHLRNLTSHTYDSKKANEVYANADELLLEAKNFLAQLKARN